MYQLKSLFSKEIKQILYNKKILLICLFFLFYVPILNFYADAKLALLDTGIIIPILFIIAGSYPSEYTYAIMNEEFDNKMYEIIYISKINSLMILLSKLMAPILIGICICFSSIFLNNMFSFFQPKMYILDISLQLAFFIILSIIFSNVFSLWILLFFRKMINRQIYTLSIFLTISIIVILFNIYYFGYMTYSFLILMIGIFLFLFFDYSILKNYQFSNNFKKSIRYIGNSNFLTLTQNAYIHVWDWKNLSICVLSIISIAIYIRFNMDTKVYMNDIYRLIPAYFNIIVSTFILPKAWSVDKKNQITIFFTIGTYERNKLLISRLLYPITLSICMSLLYFMILFKYFSIIECISYLLLLLLNVLFVFCISTYGSEKYNRVFNLFVFFVDAIFMIMMYSLVNNSFIIIILIIVLYRLSISLFLKKSVS